MLLGVIFAIWAWSSCGIAFAGMASQEEIKALSVKFPLPCVNEREEFFEHCVMDAAIDLLKSNPQTKYFPHGVLDRMAPVVAAKGSEKQQKDLLAIYRDKPKHAPFWTSGDMLLLLSLHQMDDAIATIQKKADTIAEVVEEGIPQFAALRFLVLTGKLDDAIVFFKRTQNIRFIVIEKNASFSGGLLIPPSPPAMLFAALLRDDRKKEAVELKAALDKTGVYYNALMRDNLDKYFEDYEYYEATIDKKSWAENFFATLQGRAQVLRNFLRIDEKDITQPVEELFNALASNEKSANDAYSSFRDKNKSEWLAANDLVPYIKYAKAGNAREFLWRVHLKASCRDLGRQFGETYEECIARVFGTIPKISDVWDIGLRHEYFLAKKHAQQLISQPVDSLHPKGKSP